MRNDKGNLVLFPYGTGIIAGMGDGVDANREPDEYSTFAVSYTHLPRITAPAFKRVCRFAMAALMAAVKGPAAAPATVLDRWAAVFMACKWEAALVLSLIHI